MLFRSKSSLSRGYIFQLIKAIKWCHQNDVIHRGIIPILKLVMIVGSPENSMFAS